MVVANQTKPRRTSAQVLADKAAALAKKEEKAVAVAAAKDKKLKKIADLENRMAADEENRKRDAARPPSGKIVVNVAERPKSSVRKSTPEIMKEVDELLAFDYGNDIVELDSEEESQVVLRQPKPQREPVLEEESEGEAIGAGLLIKETVLKSLLDDNRDNEGWIDRDYIPDMGASQAQSFDMDLDLEESVSEIVGEKGTGATEKVRSENKKDKKPTRGMVRDAIEALRLMKATRDDQKRKFEDVENVQQQVSPPFSSERYLTNLTLNASPLKKMKPAHPSGLLPQFKTNADTAILWNKTNFKGSHVDAGGGSEVGHSGKFSDLYGGLSDEDESQEGAGQLATLGPKNIKVRQRSYVFLL